MAMQLEIKHYIRKDAQCPHCSASYYYPHKIDVSRKYDPAYEGAEEAARKKLAADYRERAKKLSIVPCPSCKKLSKEMKSQNRAEFVAAIVFLALSLVALATVLWLVATVGVFFYVFAFFNVLVIGYSAFMIVAWPFGFSKERVGVLPGEEENASKAVKAKLAAIEAPAF